MKKRLISAGLVLTMALSMLTGCNKGADTNTLSDSNDKAASQVKYEYEQELNVIDDKYRNYYEIFVYSYYDSDGDGIGDFNGITEKLDYIKDMGFNGIWLMPIMPSPTYHKYDVTDYMAVDEAYGTMEDFKNLVEECHKRDIRIIIDMVINHSSSKHEWFLEACKYLRGLEDGQEADEEECPYINYYHFSKEKKNGTWYKIPGGDWYYEGSFWSEMPDLNWEYEGLKDVFKPIADFWVKDVQVDGFRMDAALHYNDSDSTENEEVLNWLYSYCQSINEDFYMVSEVWAAKTVITDYYNSKTDSMFNFPDSSVEGIMVKAAAGRSSAEKLVTTMLDDQQTYSSVYEDYIDAPFLSNHDQPRVSNNLLSNEDDLKMAAGILLMMNGSPFVYYGEEVGMKSSGDKDENKRVGMYWSTDSSAEGMCDGPDDADRIEMKLPSVEDQLEDVNSLLNYYKRALRLRNENPEIARGTIEIVNSLTEDDIAVITKTYEDSTIAIVYNTSDEEMTVSLTDEAVKDMNIRGYLTRNNEEITLEGGELKLPAQSICILK